MKTVVGLNKQDAGNGRPKRGRREHDCYETNFSSTDNDVCSYNDGVKRKNKEKWLE